MNLIDAWKINPNCSVQRPGTIYQFEGYGFLWQRLQDIPQNDALLNDYEIVEEKKKVVIDEVGIYIERGMHGEQLYLDGLTTFNRCEIHKALKKTVKMTLEWTE